MAETLKICSLRDPDEKFSLHQLDSLSRLSSRDRRKYEIGDCRRHHVDNHQITTLRNVAISTVNVRDYTRNMWFGIV